MTAEGSVRGMVQLFMLSVPSSLVSKEYDEWREWTNGSVVSATSVRVLLTDPGYE
jgi:hypothetical protein